MLVVGVIQSPLFLLSSLSELLGPWLASNTFRATFLLAACVNQVCLLFVSLFLKFPFSLIFLFLYPWSKAGFSSSRLCTALALHVSMLCKTL